MKFIEKPLVIDAFVPSSDEPSPSWYVEAWEHGDITSVKNDEFDGGYELAVRTEDDLWIVGSLNDWIIQYPDGSLDLIDKEVFEECWEKVEC